MLVWKKRHLREEMPFFTYMPFLSFLLFLFSFAFHLMLFLSYFYHFVGDFGYFCLPLCP